MENKNKQLEKILKKKGIRGFLKPASDNDPVDFVMIEYPKCLRHSMLFRAKDYIELVKRGEYIPEEELIHCLIVRNKKRSTKYSKQINY